MSALPGAGRASRAVATAALAFGVQAALAGPAEAGGSTQPGPPGDLDAGWKAFTGAVARGWTDAVRAVSDMPVADLTPPMAVVHARRSCPVPAPGRGADCAAAALGLCNEQGFLSGKELDIETGRVCRGTQFGLWGGTPGASCKSKSWVIQAACW